MADTPIVKQERHLGGFDFSGKTVVVTGRSTGIGKPDDIAGAVLFLSRLASYIIATSTIVDGGVSA
jgi:NAD(P)-dependent dehydrogenase (short-subunit alcohol dehydrogenase family)